MQKLILSALICLGIAASGCFNQSTKSIEGKITGVVSVSPALKTEAGSQAVLFIIARAQQSGPPSAVKRVTNPVFPYTYTIGPEDSVMSIHSDFKGDTALTLSARLSRSGNAMPSPGDLEGVFKNNPARPSDNGVDIIIDHERM